MKIGIAGPISTESIARFLHGDGGDLPRGYYGAPLLGTLIGGLLRRGHTVTAYTTSADMRPLSTTPVTAVGDRFKIVYCPVRPRAFHYQDGHRGRAVDLFRLERDALRQAILKDLPDVIHAHWTYEFALAALDTGLPHVITCHDAPQVVLRYTPNAYRLVRYFMARRVLARASQLTAVSPYLKKMVEGYAGVPVTVVPNPLPDEITGPMERVRQFDPARPRIAMVLNGWGWRKNPKPALRAFALLRQRIPGAELHVMGHDFGPGGKAELWARKNIRTESILFLGPMPYQSLLARLADADLLLHPALEETFGMSVAEAMALGVPVIGGEASGAVPWVIGNGGIVTNVMSETAIESAMSALLSNTDKHRHLAQSALARTRDNFTADHAVTAFEKIYAEARQYRALPKRKERLMA